MALSFVFNFGRLLNKGEKWTNAKLNAVVKGISANLSGTVGTADIGAAAIDTTKVQQGAYFYAAATLSAGTYTGTWTPAVSGYADGLILAFKASATNGGAVNLDAGAGAKPLRKWGGKALEAGDIATGQVVNVRYNTTLIGGGCWELVATPGQPLRDDYRYAIGTGSGGAPTLYTIPMADAPTAYVAGMHISFKASVNNNGAVNVNVNALGAQALLHKDLTAMVSNEIVGGQIVEATYDGIQFQVTSVLVPVYTPAEAVVATGRNILVKTNTGTPNSKADIAADELILKRATDGRTFLVSAVAVTADITLGVALNGMDAGVEAASTWYYLWVISDGVSVASLISLSSTAPTLPGTYLYKALAGVVRNDGGSNFVPFWGHDREIWVQDTNNAVFTATTGQTSYGSVDISAFVPPIARRVGGRIGTVTASVNTTGTVAADANGLGASGGALLGAGATAVDAYFGAVPFSVPIVTASTVYWKSAVATANAYRMSVSGYRI